ncbi:hypothetical protein [Hymenobacter psychrotolerans]|uniref:Phage major capsid protein E n=1 Tax=Hymenobacter psychrotolerans DSM 18569 TaxID=1121959 RepID=A0A1M6Z8I0_9BACT|nr:hypothetical protein [Hymenobacter psychrotolerans]SHL26766.1 hypothetical protein SAMN02746009_02456 [Hymenobacter psychrotolerans DSM 18569]
MSLQTSAIIAEFGAYYINQGQNLQRLAKLLFRPSVTDSLLTPILTDETVYRAAKTLMTRVLQPFQKAYTPLASVTFTPVGIEQFKMKIDTAEYPDELEASWLGFLTGEGIDRKSWPFIRWYIEEYLIPQSNQDYELLEVYNGVYVAPTAGTPGAAGTSMNGLKKTINTHITAGRITPIVTGALETDPEALVEQLEQFADRIGQAYWSIPMQLAVSEQVQRRFLRGQERKYGKNTKVEGMLGDKINNTNITVVGLPSMSGANKIWCTPKANALVLGKRTGNQGKFQVENVDRQVKVYSDWSKGVGFIIPEIVYTNDQDLA